MMKKIISASIIAIILVCLILPLTTALTNYRYYTRVTFQNTTAAAISGRFVASINAAGLVSQGFMQSDADDVRIGTESDISYNSLTSGTGTFTGSPIKLVVGANTVACTVAGTAIIRLPDGYTGTAATGTMTVDLSPVALVAGANTITTSGGVGNITVTIVYVSYSSSTVGELANTAAYWYSDYITVPAYSSVSRDIWTGNGSALPRDQWWISDDADVNTVADAATLDITTNLTLSAQVNLTALPLAEKEIISKEGNYELAVNATHYIFRVWKAGAAGLTGNVNPNANGTLNQHPNVVGAATAWQAVSDANDATYIASASDAGHTLTDRFAIDTSAIPQGVVINSVTVYIRVYVSGCSGWWAFNPVAFLGSATTTGIGNYDPALGGTWYNTSEALARPGGGTWTREDLDLLQIGVKQVLGACGGAEGRVSKIYAVINYDDKDGGHVSQIAATAGSTKTITCTYDGANTINITDGTLSDPQVLAGALFTNADPIHIAEVDGKVDDIKIGDTSIAAPTWRLNLTFEASDITGTGAATTVQDHSASNNDMTSTRAGNPAGITTTVSGMLPSTPSTVPIVGVGGLVTDATKEFNPQDYTIPEVGSNLTNLEIPGMIIGVASEASGVQSNWVWWFVYGLICICLFLVGIRYLGGHITISWIMVIIATACFVSWNVIPWWFIMIYSIFALGSLAWENRTTI